MVQSLNVNNSNDNLFLIILVKYPDKITPLKNSSLTRFPFFMPNELISNSDKQSRLLFIFLILPIGHE